MNAFRILVVLTGDLEPQFESRWRVQLDI